MKIIPPLPPLADPPIPLIFTLEEVTINLPEEEGPGGQGVSLAAFPASEAVNSGERIVIQSICTSRISEIGVGIELGSAKPTSSWSLSATPTGDISSNKNTPPCNKTLTQNSGSPARYQAPHLSLLAQPRSRCYPGRGAPPPPSRRHQAQPNEGRRGKKRYLDNAGSRDRLRWKREF